VRPHPAHPVQLLDVLQRPARQRRGVRGQQAEHDVPGPGREVDGEGAPLLRQRLRHPEGVPRPALDLDEGEHRVRVPPVTGDVDRPLVTQPRPPAGEGDRVRPDDGREPRPRRTWRHLDGVDQSLVERVQCHFLRHPTIFR
jgi:hypothetical protein